MGRGASAAAVSRNKQQQEGKGTTQLMFVRGDHAWPQLPQRRPLELSNKRLSKKNKTIHRAYGGHLSHSVVRER